MKYILTILLIVELGTANAQFINTTTVGSNTTMFKSKGGIGADSAIVFLNSFPDTTTANFSVISKYNSIIRIGTAYWYRTLAPNKWNPFASGITGSFLFISDTAAMLSNYYNKTAADGRFVHLTGNETIAGNKYFSGRTYFYEHAYNAPVANYMNILADSSYFGFYNGESSGKATFYYSKHFDGTTWASRLYYLPVSDGTLALTSDIPSITGKLNISDTSGMLFNYYNKTAADGRFVHLTGNETIGGAKTFNTRVNVIATNSGDAYILNGMDYSNTYHIAYLGQTSTNTGYLALADNLGNQGTFINGNGYSKINDNTYNAYGVGVGFAADNGSGAKLQVNGNVSAVKYLGESSTNTVLSGTDSAFYSSVNDGGGYLRMNLYGTSASGTTIGATNNSLATILTSPSGVSGLIIGTQNNIPLVFETSKLERARFHFTTGNLLIGTGADNGLGQLLQVNGGVYASSYVKSGGTSTQYLMADGSVTTSSGLFTYNATDPNGSNGSSYTPSNYPIALQMGGFYGGYISVTTSSFTVNGNYRLIELKSGASSVNVSSTATGQDYFIFNSTGSSISISFTLKDLTGTTLTTIPANTSYHIFYNGTNYIKI